MRAIDPVIFAFSNHRGNRSGLRFLTFSDASEANCSRPDMVGPGGSNATVSR
jgi:hypothetical protein